MKMDRAKGLKLIEEASWTPVKDGEGTLKLTVLDTKGYPCTMYLSARPAHCDRGHLKLHIESHFNLGIDDADSFPRYFFSFGEAFNHAKLFLMWRIWKEPSSDRPEQVRLTDMLKKLEK